MSKTVVISGVGKGLGWELLQLHAQRGDEVYAWDRQIDADNRAFAEDRENVRLLACDITSPDEVAAAAAQIPAPHIDILYNVAGVHREEDLVPLAETDFDEFRREYDINAVGPMRVSQALLGKLGAGTVVVMISSEAGSIGIARREGEYAYCMSKAALNMGVKLLSNELFHKGARCIAIHPGWLRSPMGGQRAAQAASSVSTAESAQNILGILDDIRSIPPDRLFMTHERELLPW